MQAWCINAEFLCKAFGLTFVFSGRTSSAFRFTESSMRCRIAINRHALWQSRLGERFKKEPLRGWKVSVLA
jgi:hypothetical protein